jgi:hypothetical protein
MRMRPKRRGANILPLAAFMVLGLGYLLPFYLLLVVGVGPVTAGIALIPGTIPIILARPLRGACSIAPADAGR